MAGLYFEEFTVGQVFKHQPGRTVTEADNVLFTTMTMNRSRCTWTRRLPVRRNSGSGWSIAC